MAKYIENIQLVNGVKYKINTVPAGGQEGQVLTKTGEGREDLQWLTPEKYDDTELREGLAAVEQDVADLQQDKADKTQVEEDLAKKADKETTFTKDEVNELIKDFATEEKVAEDINAAKQEIQGKLDLKADKETTYTKTEIDTKFEEFTPDLSEYAKTADVNGQLDKKADKETTFTKEEVNNLISGLSDSVAETYVTEQEFLQTLEAEIPTKVSDLQNDAGYLVASDIEGKADKADVYTKTEIDGKLTGAFHYKGNVENEEALPANAEQGDVYNNLENGANYAFNGKEWDKLSETLDLSVFYTKTEADAKFTTLDVVNAQGFLKQDALEPFALKTELPTDFYSKEETDNKLSAKANASEVYTKEEADATFVKEIPADLITEDELAAKNYLVAADIEDKAEKADVYTKQEVEDLIAGAVTDGKLDLSEYAKTLDVNAALDLKADKATTYTKDDVDGLLEVVNKAITDGLAEKQDKGDYALASDLTAATQQHGQDVQALTELINGKQAAGDYATKTDLQNAIKDFITDVPEEFITETELAAKNYITIGDVEAKNYTTMAEVEAKQYLTAADVADKANKDDVYTKTEIDGKLAGAFHYKGNVAAVADLPETAEIGDVYNVEADGSNYAFNGEQWDKLSETLDLSVFYTKTEADAKFATKEELAPLATKEEVATKQNKLIAGPGVFIENDVISAVGFEASYDEETATLIFSAAASYTNAYNLTDEILGE